MEIIVGKTAGFCYGVKRAVDGAKKEIEETKETVYCLGEIVHNSKVIESLKSNGLIFIENLEEGQSKTIIRAHGVTREVLLEKVWGYEYYGDIRTVDVTVRRIREKIEKNTSNPKILITKRGVGYYLAGK